MRLKRLLFLLTSLLIAVSFAWGTLDLFDGILGPEVVAVDVETVFSEPTGSLSAKIVTNLLKCEVKPKLFSCLGTGPVDLELIIQESSVPSSATANLVALNLREKYQNQSSYKLLKKPEKIDIDQTVAVVQTFSYAELDNIDRPVWIRTLSAVKAKRLVSVEARCRSFDCEPYLRAIDTVFASLKMKPVKSIQASPKKTP